MASGPAGTTDGVANNNPLAQPGQVLSGKALIDAAHALANSQTQGPMTELARQIAQNNAQGANAQKLTSGYFNQLGQMGQQGVTDENQIASGLNSTLKGIAGDEQNQLQGVAQNGVNSLLKYAPQGEGGLAQPALGSLITELARQQGLAAQNEGAFRNFGATQGANYGGLAASNLGAFGSRGQELIGDMGRATQLQNEPLQAKIAALRQTQGADFATDLGKLRQQEITNSYTQQGLGIKGLGAQASLTSAQAAAQNAQTNAGKLNIDQWNANPNNVGSAAWYRSQQASNASGKLDLAQQAANANAVGSQAWYRQAQINLKSGKTTGVTPLTTNENNKALATLGKIINAIGYYRTNGIAGAAVQNGKTVKTLTRNPSEQQIKSALSAYDGSGVLTEAAYELLGYGSIDQQTANNMRRMGINVGAGSFRGKPIKVTPNFSPSNPLQANLGGAF